MISFSIFASLDYLIMNNFIRSFIGCNWQKLEFLLVLAVVQELIRVVTKQSCLAIFVAHLDFLELLKHIIVKFLEVELITISLLLSNNHLPLFLPKNIEELNILSLFRSDFRYV